MNSSKSNKINILYLSHLSEMHGAERVLLLLLENMTDRFNSVVVLPKNGPLKTRLENLNIKTYVLPINPWICPSGVSDGRFIFSLINNMKENLEAIVCIIKQEKIDIVHTNTSTIIDGALGAAIAGRPHIWHLHEILKDNPAFRHIIPLNKVFKNITTLSHKIVSVSTTVDKQITTGEKERRCVIYNGINTGYEKRVNDNIRRELGLNNNISLVLSIGAIIEKKGYEYLIDAIPDIVSQYEKVRFLIVGPVIDSLLHDKIKKKVCQMGIGKYITFLGYRDDVPEILQNADLFVMPSVKEAFPLSLLEAMAAGMPVVATKCGGPEEIVIDGETGYLVPSCCGNALKDAILTLLKEKDRAEQMGKNGKRRVEENFGLNTFIERWQKLYEEIEEDKSIKFPDSETVTEIIFDLLRPAAIIGLNIVSRNEQLEGFQKRVKNTFVYKFYKHL